MNAEYLLDLTDMFALMVRMGCTETECEALDQDLTSLHERVDKFKIVLRGNGI